MVPKSSWKLVHSERAWDTAILGPKNCSTHFNHMLISHHHTGYTADTCDPRAESERLCRELGPNTSTGHQICRRLDQWLPTLHIAQGRIIWRDRFIVVNHVLHWYYMILHLEPRDASRAKLLVGQRCWSTPARKSWPHPQPISRAPEVWELNCWDVQWWRVTHGIRRFEESIPINIYIKVNDHDTVNAKS